MAHRGDWVRLRSVILSPGGRAPQVPEDTAETPLTQWVKGWLISDADIGSKARVRTQTGREVEGILQEVFPFYDHGFGEFIPELHKVREDIRRVMRDGGAEE